MNSFDCYAIKLSAVFSGVKDIKDALEQAEQNALGPFDKPTVLLLMKFTALIRHNKMSSYII